MRETYIRFVSSLICFTILLGGSCLRAGDSGTLRASTPAAPGLRVPVLGFVASGSPPVLRPILGIVGAAVLGDPLPIQPEPSLLAVSPDQSLVLIGRGPSQGLTVAPLGAAGAGPELGIEGSLSGAERAVFSPSGASAVVTSGRGGRLQVLTGFPAEPKVAFEIDASAFAAGLRSLAVTDDGGSVLVGTSDGVTGSVRLFAKDAAPITLLQAGNPAVVRLSADSAGALVVDSALRQVTLLDRLNGQATARVFPAATGGDTVGPDDAVLSDDGKRLYTLYASRNEARAVDLDNGAVTLFEFGGGALDLGRLPRTRQSLRSSPDGRSVWLVDFSGLEPLSRYIPPLPAEPGVGAQEVAQ